jgi:hypothetical protein
MYSTWRRHSTCPKASLRLDSLLKKSERENVDWLGDILVDLKNFRVRLFEECPWLLSEGAGERGRWEWLKSRLIGSATLEKAFFLGSLGLCELSFAMLTT